LAFSDDFLSDCAVLVGRKNRGAKPGSNGNGARRDMLACLFFGPFAPEMAVQVH
jgi:hypothetical protein